jgi:hypothetical protein
MSQDKRIVVRRPTSHGWVASHALDQGAKHRADTDTGTGEANGGKTGTLHLGHGENGGSGGLGNNASRLHGTAGDAGGHVAADAVEEQAGVRDDGLTRLAENGALDTSWA